MNPMQASPQFDDRAGDAWLRALDDPTRLRLMAALLNRFNHDLRTPINTVSGWMHLLQHSSDAARIAHVSSVIARNVNEQTTLLEEFIDDGRVVLGTLTRAAAPAIVRDVVAAALERAAAVASLHVVELQSRLPEAGAPINVDAPRLQRLVYRLVAAVIRRGGEESVVKVEVDDDPHRCVVRAGSSSSSGDWTEAALLDLRLATLHAALQRGRLDIASSAVELSIPLSTD